MCKYMVELYNKLNKQTNNETNVCVECNSDISSSGLAMYIKKDSIVYNKINKTGWIHSECLDEIIEEINIKK